MSRKPPIGSVLAYAGEVDPRDTLKEKWMLCNGRALSSDDHSVLFRVIKTRYGEGVDENGDSVSGKDFNLPDYRGMFLRGTKSGRPPVDISDDRTVDFDPDEGKRLDHRWKSQSSEVGSVQLSEFESHSHHILYEGDTDKPKERRYAAHRKDWQKNKVSNTHRPSFDSGGLETRPLNVYVNWIIRVE